MSAITVGVVARRGPEALQRTLDALEPQLGEEDEVLAMRGSSRAGARNQVLAEASCPVVAFLEDGLRPSPRWMDAWRGTFRDQEVEAAAGSFQPLSSTAGREGEREGGSGGRLRWTGRLEADFTGPRTGVTTLARGSNFAVRRALAAEQGGFDESFGPSDPYGDAEFFLRLAKGGARTRYVPGARVLDPDPSWRPPGDLPPSLRLQEEALRSRWMAALFARHEVWALAVMVSSHLLQSVLGVAAGDLPASAPARIFQELAAGIRAGVAPPVSRLIADRKNVRD